LLRHFPLPISLQMIAVFAPAAPLVAATLLVVLAGCHAMQSEASRLAFLCRRC